MSAADLVIGNTQGIACNVYKRIFVTPGTDPDHLVLVTSQYRDSTPASALYRSFTVTGDGTGNANLATAGTVYSVISDAGKITYLERLCILITDDAIRLNRFAGISITNGLVFTANATSGTVLTTYNTVPITTLGHFGLLAGVDIPVLPDVGDDSWSCRWTLNKAGNSLMLEPGQSMRLSITTSLSALTEFYITAQGHTTDA